MKVSRLVQPRNPVFWLMLALNAMSPALAWVVQNRPLNVLGSLMVTVFAIGNALLGVWLAWRLMRDDTPPAAADAPPQDLS